MVPELWKSGIQAVGWIAGISAGSAQITFDGSLGAPGNLSGSTVDASRGQSAGGNLFHSFSQFNVGAGQKITFQVPPQALNVLARVTGQSVSRINGTLGTDAPANLYLINPNGVILGEAAQINVAGSFVATSADYISFRDGSGAELGRFWASGDGNVSLLTVAPSAFGFLKQADLNAGRIELAAGVVDAAKTELSLVGRNVVASNVSVSGRGLTLTAAGAHAQELAIQDPVLLPDSEGGLVSVDGAQLGTTGSGEIVIRAAGDVFLTGAFLSSASAIKVRGERDVSLTNSALIGEPVPAAIAVEAGGNLQLGNSFLQSFGSGSELSLKAGGDIGMISGAATTSGNLTVVAGRDLDVTGGSIGMVTGSVASGGRVLVKAGRDIAIRNLGNISTSSAGAGDGGNLVVCAGGNLFIEGSDLEVPALIFTEAKGLGRGGNIVVEVGSKLSMSEGGTISSISEGAGDGGRVTVQAGSVAIRGGESLLPTGILSDAQGSGRGGDLDVEVSSGIKIEEVGQITASTAASGPSGSIWVEGGSLHVIGADESRHPEGSDPRKNFFVTGINLKSSQTSSGELGSLVVNIKNDIILERGGLIDATVFSFNNAANAGNLTVTAGSIYADRMASSYFTGIGSGTEANVPSAGGRGGNVSVTADSIHLLNGAQIAASTRSAGAAGNIEVNTRELFAAGRGSLTNYVFSEESGVVAASEIAATGNAGSVTIRATGNPGTGAGPRLRLTDGAEIAATVAGSGDGGSVMVDWAHGSIHLSNGGSISARAGTLGGDAGSVGVIARNIHLGSGGSISSSNDGSGAAGSVVLHPGNSLRLRGGTLAVSSKGGDAGDIEINGGMILDFRNADVVAEALGNGGNIRMTGGRSLLFSDSRVSANAIEGDGGNITLEALRYLPGNTTPTASSQLGVDGLVEIDAVEILAESTGELEAAPLDVSDSLQPECSQRLPTEAGSFIRAGRGGTRRLPGGYIPSVRLLKTVPEPVRD